MDHWGLWDWTKFICCNHRPIEAGERIVGYYHKNGQEFQVIDTSPGVHYDYNQYYYTENPIHPGYIPINVDPNSGTIMDGLRVQLQRRKSGGALRSPSVKRTNDTQPTLRGWLYRLEGAALKQWKRRWFVLADYCLFYYKDMEEEKLLGSILLPSYKITPCLSDDGVARKFAFKAEHSNMKTYYFSADSKESMTQWMNALSLASIMQLSSAFSTVRNSGDGQEVVNNDDESESGFASYQSRRSGSAIPAPSIASPHELTNLGSGDKYPGSYNSIGLPIPYQQVQRPIQRAHYVNAPPKPKRQYYETSDLYCIPPSAQYHQQQQQQQQQPQQQQTSQTAISQATPDLIAHDSYNSNYLASAYYSQSNGSYAPNAYDQQQYRLPINQQKYTRLPPRPHSADFLERDQDEDEYQKMLTSPINSAPPPESYFPPSPPEPIKILPMRPKSSLERYDPYYARYYYDQPNYSASHYSQGNHIQNHKEPRPWSDFLAASGGNGSNGNGGTGAGILSPSCNDNQMLNSYAPIGDTQMNHYRSVNSNINNYQTDHDNIRGNPREESLQRLLEWKQRMLQSPLTKRNWHQQQGLQSMKGDLPSRPPLPEEYRNKFAIRDALRGPNQYLPKERSKSSGDGSEFVSLSNGNRNRNGDALLAQKNMTISYSSDDEAELKDNTFPMQQYNSYNEKIGYNDNNNNGHNTPDYININCLNKSASITSTEDTVFEYDKESSDLDIRKEDYYKASTMFYQRQSHSGRESILMSPVSFNESYTKVNDIGPVSPQEWANVGLPIPDEASLARTSSRRSLRRINTGNDLKNASDIKPDIKLEKREDGDGHGSDYSVKALLKKFGENSQNNNNKQTHHFTHESDNSKIKVPNKTQSFTDVSRLITYNQKCAINGDVANRSPNSNAKTFVSDSEVLDNDSNDDNTIKSAPVILSPFSSVLADLRKTADVRKEKLYAETQNEKKTLSVSIDEVIITKGALQLSINENTIQHQSPQYIPMDKSTTAVKHEDVYVPMDEKIEEKESDAADDADDEASRDFDAINYQSESVIPENGIKLKPGCRVRTYKKPRPEPVPVIPNTSMTYQRASQHHQMSKEMLNPNPAYESFDGIRIGNNPIPELPNHITKGDSNGDKSQRSPNAPYYYSDLLSEEQQLALQERLAAYQSSSPPPLLSRCNALNNTRFLGITSLQKSDIGRRVNKIAPLPVSSPNNVLNNSNNSNDLEQSIKSMICPFDVSKFLDAEKNKYEAGHTLQKISPEWKRCVTPDVYQLPSRSVSDVLTQNIESIAKRRSKSFESLGDALQDNHIYENLGQFTNNIDDTCANNHDNNDNNSDDEYFDKEVLRRVSEKHFNERLNLISPIRSLISQQSNSVVPLVERLEKNFDNEDSDGISGSSSSMSSMIELDSVSGPIMAEKVRKRRSLHKRRSKDDLNVSDSEIQKPIITKSMHVKPKSLRDSKSTRLCVSTGDLLGKSHEELVLMLIQLRRTQAQLIKTCDQLRMQMESEEKLIEIEPHKRDDHKLKYRELREKLSEYEKQYDIQFPMINAVDNMVKLNHPQTAEELSADNRAKAASTSILDQVTLEEEETNLSSLQQDKEILERTLEGVKSKVEKMGNELSPPVNLDKLKKQQKMLEGELTRVRGLLTHSAKRLEEKAAENAQMEHDVQIARKKLKQVIANEQSQSDIIESHKAACLEAELAHIDQVIDDLHSRRKELNAAIEHLKINDVNVKREVRASPTGLAGSAPLPGKKKITTTYMETDLDTMDTRDLAHCTVFRNSGSEGEETPLYENLETNNSFNTDPNLLMCDTEDLIAQLANDDPIDDQMKQFYGIIPPPAVQKANEIKTVRIVKRENERRRIHFANGTNNGSNRNNTNDLFWNYESTMSSDYTGAVGGYGAIPPPYYYDDDMDEDDEEDDSQTNARSNNVNNNNNSNNGKEECSDGKHCPGNACISMENEFKRTYSLPMGNIQRAAPYTSDTKQQQIQLLVSSPMPPQRTRSASVSLPSSSSTSSSLMSSSSSPFSYRLTQMRQLESKYGQLTPQRRHRTISYSQPQLYKYSPHSVSSLWKTCDDNDLKYCSSLNTPDIVKSTIKKNGDVFDEKIIEREIMLPQKIDIPERYVPDDEPEELTASERLKRSMKAEMIRRMLSESTTYEDVRRDVSQPSASSSSSSSAVFEDAEARVKLNEEKRRRAQLLALNHELAKEVMEQRNRFVSGNSIVQSGH